MTLALTHSIGIKSIFDAYKSMARSAAMVCAAIPLALTARDRLLEAGQPSALALPRDRPINSAAA